MIRCIAALLLVIPLCAQAETTPTGACPFIGFESDPQKQPNLAEVATKTPARMWIACDSPRGCVLLRVQPGSLVELYKTVGPWTCGYTEDRHGGAPAWFRSEDLRRLDFPADPPIAAWYGLWKGGEDRVMISPAKQRVALHLVGRAIWNGLNGNEHFGEIEGSAMPSGNRLHYVSDGCIVDLTLAGKYILASDNQGCGGLNARFSGFWKRASEPPVAGAKR